MAEKEERILIDVINPGINCVYRLDNDPKGQSLCKHNGNMEPVTARECRHCEEGMTRHEAICKIARAICRAGGNECIGDCESCDLWEVGPEKEYAEAALNALLSSGE